MSPVKRFSRTQTGQKQKRDGSWANKFDNKHSVKYSLWKSIMIITVITWCTLVGLTWSCMRRPAQRRSCPCWSLGQVMNCLGLSAHLSLTQRWKTAFYVQALNIASASARWLCLFSNCSVISSPNDVVAGSTQEERTTVESERAILLTQFHGEAIGSPNMNLVTDPAFLKLLKKKR